MAIKVCAADDLMLNDSSFDWAALKKYSALILLSFKVVLDALLSSIMSGILRINYPIP